jgi:transcriptional regulator with XRE-family HTH domain
MSQLDLSTRAGVTPRHVSFVETGRSNPSREMLHLLAEHLDMPLRDRNELYLAAGFAPPYSAMSADDDAFDEIIAALRRILASHEPLPGVIMDRNWNLVHANTAAQTLFASMLDLEAIDQPANVLRLMFGPLRSHVRNWDQVANALVTRARREAVGGIPDPELQALLDEMSARLTASPGPPTHASPIIDVEFIIDGTVHAYFSTITTLGTSADVTLQELRLELFHPQPTEQPSDASADPHSPRTQQVREEVRLNSHARLPSSRRAKVVHESTRLKSTNPGGSDD